MITSEFLESISKLHLSLNKRSTLNHAGNRKSVQKGSSTEFSGFREYIQGDDPRRIDWNAYGRLNKLYIKEYLEEKENIVQVIIDTSGSMNYGKNNKSELASKLAVLFAYISILDLDRCIIYDIKHPESPFVCGHGKNAVSPLLSWINKLSFEEDINISSSIEKLPLKKEGITIVISDFWGEEFIENDFALSKMLKYFNYLNQKIIICHVLSGEELNADYTGTLNLIDMENKNKLRVSMENKSISLYKNALNQFLDILSNTSNKYGAGYCLCNTDLSFTQIIYEKLRFAYDI